MGADIQTFILGTSGRTGSRRSSPLLPKYLPLKRGVTVFSFDGYEPGHWGSVWFRSVDVGG